MKTHDGLDLGRFLFEQANESNEQALRYLAMGREQALKPIIAAYDDAIARGLPIPTILTAALEQAKRGRE